MKLVQIYEKPIDRIVNPAVSVSNRDAETIRAEIQEYVFTEELIEKLYRFLTNVTSGKSSGTGIWVNGYYGSGKSHFIKYVDFCLSSTTQESAFEHFLKAVQNPDREFSEVTASNVLLLQSLVHKAKPETIMFNVEDETDDGSGEKLTRIFLNMLNRHRGYNPDDIPVALLLEKELDKQGMFEQFQKLLKENHQKVWKGNEQNLAAFFLETVLDVAKEVLPQLDTVSLHNKLSNPDTYKVSIASTLIPELKDYLNGKSKDFRLVFLVDEISQYVGKNKELLLNLQSIVTRIGEDLSNKVWVACTAQQTIEELAHGVGTDDIQDEFGKILGRFPSEFRVSLESSDPAYITKKRILDKNGEGRIAVESLYRGSRDAIESQFRMHHDLYKGYDSEREFLMSYPFVPYQFRLVADVFDAFQSLQFVIKEVKKNERSVLGITHFTAQKNSSQEVGYFIPFDAFFNEQFNTNLTHRGRNAISPAHELSYVRNNPFARRVVNVLFMVSNLSEATRQTFPSNIDNLTLLLMSDLDQNKLQLRNKIQEVLDKLKDESVIREETGSFFFFNEDEMDVMMQVQNTGINYEDRLDEYDKLIRPLLRIENKTRFGQNDFKVGYNMEDKEILRNGNVVVRILTLDNSTAEQKSFGNPANSLLLCINEWLVRDEELRKQLELYFKTEKFLRLNGDASGTRGKTIDNFRSRNATLREKLIRTIEHRLPETRFVSGQQVIDPSAINGTKPAERYQNVLEKHMGMVYRFHHLAASYAATAADLRIKMPTIKAQQLTSNAQDQAESRIEEKISLTGGEMSVDDIIREFSKEPYGWKDTQVIHILVMLNKKKKREFTYRGQPRYPMDQFVEKALIATERIALMVKRGEDIPAEVVEEARLHFNDIFNISLPHLTDAGEVFESMVKQIKEAKGKAADKAEKLIRFPFRQSFHNFQNKLEELEEIRDPRRFFEMLGTAREELKSISDQCKQLDNFVDRALTEYRNINQFFTDNKENLSALPDGHAERMTWLTGFFASEDPSTDFRTARKIHDELKTALDDLKKQLLNEIEVTYNRVFDSLEAELEIQKVDNVIASRNYTIDRLKKQASIAALRLAISQADSFRTGELQKILQEVERKKRTSGGPVAEDKFYKYKPGNATKNHIISNEDELDQYLTKLRGEMLKILKENKKIILE